LRTVIVQNLESRFRSYADLVGEIDDTALQERLAAPGHKSLAEHLWCVIGARESYAKALVAGGWQGFGCSLTGHARADFEAKLESSSRAVREAIAGVKEWTREREELLATLAEHEVMHEGQIIRHMVGLSRTPPESWKWA
jgi:hypothetical protein